MPIYDREANTALPYDVDGNVRKAAYCVDGSVCYQASIRILEYNVGNFANGETGGYSGNDLIGYIDTWKAFFNSCDADVALITESRKYIDSSNTTLSKTGLYEDVFGYCSENYGTSTPWGKVLLTNAAQSGVVSKRFTNQRSTSSGYVGASVTINGISVFIVSVHFIHDANNADIRALQMQELINDVSGYSNVIIGGDMNTPDISELSVLESAGFVFANTTPTNTYAYPTPTLPLDNVGIRGSGLAIKSFSALGAVSLSDHIPTITEIQIN